jgi:hypothetical protein
MARLDAWLGNTSPLSTWTDDHDMAVDTAILIADKPQSITVTRGGSALSAQTVRVDSLSGSRQITTSAGQVHQAEAIVLGYKGHSTITNTDLLPGDRFKVGGTLYEVIALVPNTLDGLQAYCSVKG